MVLSTAHILPSGLRYSKRARRWKSIVRCLSPLMFIYYYYYYAMWYEPRSPYLTPASQLFCYKQSWIIYLEDWKIERIPKDFLQVFLHPKFIFLLLISICMAFTNKFPMDSPIMTSFFIKYSETQNAWSIPRIGIFYSFWCLALEGCSTGPIPRIHIGYGLVWFGHALVTFGHLLV